MRQDWDEYFMDIAMSARTRGTCPRRQVGCVITKNKLVKGTGYNGAPPTLAHCTDVGCDMVEGTCRRTTHAEANAIKFTSLRARAGGTIYTTDFPCPSCAQRIADSGLVEVVYMIPYHTGEAETLQLFEHHGIIVRRFVPWYFIEDSAAMTLSQQGYSEPELWPTG